MTLVELMREKGTVSPNLACFHVRQAAEKYLKGFLAYHDLHIRKVHNSTLSRGIRTTLSCSRPKTAKKQGARHSASRNLC
ncbi:MAG: HEPN domain-containing protein [Candidatus Sungbacteria bacterium]|nr:HEPN domain-containing protein [Candidatus Sungbacteria bacterium]